MTTWTVRSGTQLAYLSSGVDQSVTRSGWDYLSRSAEEESGQTRRRRTRAGAFLAHLFDDDIDLTDEVGSNDRTRRDAVTLRAAETESGPDSQTQENERLPDPEQDARPARGRRAQPRHAARR